MFDKNNLRETVKNYNLNNEKANCLIKTGMLYEPKETLALIREVQEETYPQGFLKNYTTIYL